MKYPLMILAIVVVILFPTIQAEAVEVFDNSLANDARQVPRTTAVYSSTSEYLIGSVAVDVILPESDGTIDPSTENWDDDEAALILLKVSSAMSWWAAREPRAGLTFSITLTRLATSYEPITRPRSGEGLWVGEIMAKLGYSELSFFERVRHHNQDLRKARETDWAVTIFVVDGSDDPDGSFSDGEFAYAYLGGPSAVMTYGNNDYGPEHLDTVIAHEFGHLFYALDQDGRAQVSCTARSGVLDAENQNSEYGGCASNVPSLMRGQVAPFLAGALDRFAREQVGWRDSDCDGILDPVDDELGVCHTLYLPIVTSY